MKYVAIVASGIFEQNRYQEQAEAFAKMLERANADAGEKVFETFITDDAKEAVRWAAQWAEGGKILFLSSAYRTAAEQLAREYKRRLSIYVLDGRGPELGEPVIIYKRWLDGLFTEKATTLPDYLI